MMDSLPGGNPFTGPRRDLLVASIIRPVARVTDAVRARDTRGGGVSVRRGWRLWPVLLLVAAGIAIPGFGLKWCKTMIPCFGPNKKRPTATSRRTTALEPKVSKSITIWLGACMMLSVILLVGCSDEPNPSPVANILTSPTPTATATPSPTPTAMPTPVPTPTSVPTPTPMPVPTATATPTATPTPTSTPTAEEMELAALARPPEHMVYAWWDWDYSNAQRDHESALGQITVDVEIHNDIELAGRNGIYLMVCSGDVEGIGYYFGLQTNVHDPNMGNRYRGKGLIFSRWDERDLKHARPAEDGWTQSSGHEGDFIGVRRSYDWGSGTYRLRIGPDGADAGGQWYGVWITDMSTGQETWSGSLKFPYVSGPALLRPRCYNTVEIYGKPIAPQDVPYLKVTLSPPMGDGEAASLTVAGRSPFTGEFRNARFEINDDGAIVYEVGLDRIEASGRD